MKKLLFILLVVAFASNLAIAGDDITPKDKSGDKAWMFSFGGFATNTYQGGIGMKYFMSDGMALRFGLGFNYYTKKDKNLTVPLPAGQLSESKYTDMMFQIVPGLQYNFATMGSVTAYLGGQISLGITSKEREGNSSGFGVAYTENNKYKETGTTIGVAAFTGVEWFVASNISLAAEYQLGFSTISGKMEGTASNVTTSVDKPAEMNLGTSAGSLTVSIYW